MGFHIWHTKSRWFSTRWFFCKYFEDPNDDGSFTETVGAEEFLNEFGGNAIKSPFQDGHYIYSVVAGGGSGEGSFSPILFIADLESPKNFNKNYNLN